MDRLGSHLTTNLLVGGFNPWRARANSRDDGSRQAASTRGLINWYRCDEHGVNRHGYTIFYSLQLNGNLSDVAKSLLPFLLFNALPMLGVLIVLGLCLLAMKNEKAKPSASFVLAFFGVGMVLTGMLGNVLLRINDLKLSNTVFEEAVLVYVGYGVVLSSLGAIAYFGPRIWGRKMPTMPVIGLGLIGVLGVVFAALPYYIAGFTDQPAGSISGQLGDNSQIWNSVATAGQTIFLVFVVAFVGLVIKSSRSGEIADEAIFETVQANS